MATYDQGYGPTPSFGAYLDSTTAWPSSLPQPAKRNLLAAGLSAGTDEFLGSLGSFAQAIGDATGWQGLAEAGKGYADRKQLESTKNGRPDLEIAPWKDDGASVLPWLGYQAAKQVPQLAALVAGGAIVPQAAVPAALARVGARVPALLGGGGALTGEAAALAGRQWAAGLVGGAAAGYPGAVGQMYQQADEGGETGQGPALKALAMGVPYAALDAIEPAQLRGFVSRGVEAPLAKGVTGLKGTLARAGERVARAGAAAGASESIQEAAQTIMELSFRSDLTPEQRLTNVVDAAVTGGAVGGLFGGIAGVRTVRKTPAENVTNDQLATAADEMMQPRLALPAPTSSPMFVDPAGQVSQSLYESDNAKRSAADAAEMAVARMGAAPPQLTYQPAMFANPEGQAAADLQGEFSPPVSLEEPSLGPQMIDMRRNLRATAQEWAGTKQIPQIDATDEAGLVGWVQDRLTKLDQAGKTWPEYLVRMAQRAGILDEQAQPRDLDAEIEQTVTALRGATPEQGNALRAQLADLSAKREMLASVAQRSGPTPLASNLRQEVANAAPEPVPGTSGEIPQTLMAERLLSAKRQIEQNAAKAQVAEAAAAAAAKTAPDMAVQAAASEPARFDFKAVESGNPALDRAKRRTVAGINAMTAEQQEAILGREEFATAADPVAALLGVVRAARDQTQLRNILAGIAGADPAVFTNAKDPGSRQSGRVVPASERVVRPASAAGTGSVVSESAPAPGAATAAAQPAPVRVAAPAQAAAPRAPVAAQPAAQTDGQAQSAAVVAAPPVTAEIVQPKQVSKVPAREVPGPNTKEEQQGPKLTPKQEQEAFFLNRIGELENAGTDPATVRQLREMVTRGDKPQDIAKAYRKAVRGEKLAGVEKQVVQRAANVRTLPPEARVKAVQMIKKGDLSGAIDVMLRAQQKQGRNLAGQLDPALEKMSKQVTVAVTNGMPAEIAQTFIEDAINAQQPIVQSAQEAALSELSDNTLAQVSARYNNIRGADTFPRFSGIIRAVQEISRKLGVETPAMWVAAPQHGQLGLAIGSRHIILADNLDPRQAINVAMHELGHVVEIALFTKAPIETKRAIWQVYRSTTIDAKRAGATVRQLMPVTSFGLSEEFQSANADRTAQHSFNEWFAEQVSRWLTTNEKPVSVVDKFFARIGEVWRAIYERVTGHVGLSKEVADFMEGAWRDDIGTRRLTLGEGGPVQFAQASTTPQETTRTAEDWARTASDVANRFRLSDIATQLRGKYKEYSSLLGLADAYKGDFAGGGAVKYATAQQQRSGILQRLSTLTNGVSSRAEQMRDASPKGKELFATLEKMATHWPALEIDPSKPWSKQPKLEVLKERYGAERLTKIVAEANADYNQLRNTKVPGMPDDFRALQIYQDMIHSQSGLLKQNMALKLHMLVTGKGMENIARALGVSNKTELMDRYMETAGEAETPKSYHDFWNAELNRLVEGSRAYIAKQTANMKDKSTKGLEVDPLAQEIREIDRKLTSLKEEPYFHLGRTGEFFTSFHMMKGKDGKVDRKTVEAIAKAMEDAGVNGVEIPRDATNAKVFIRSESLFEADRIRQVAEQLREAGHVYVDPPNSGKKNPKVIRSGPREGGERQRENGVMIRQLQAQLAQIAASVEGENKKDVRAAYNAISAQLTQYLEDMLPDHSETRMLLRREYVPGYSTDAMRNFAQRTQAGMHAVANIAMSAKTLDALRSMREDISAAQTRPDMLKTTRMQQVYDEFVTRESQRSTNAPDSFVAGVRAFNHAYFLGLSPAYALVQLTQTPVLTIPELAKTHGVMKSTRAVTRVGGEALKILSAAFRQAKSEGGWMGAMDVHLDLDVLKKAGLSDQRARAVMRLVMDGAIDLGSASRELGRRVEGREDTKVDKGLRVAASVGLYSETYSRLVAALAALDLHGDRPGAHEYALNVINQSMFAFNSWNTARGLGTHGFLGRYTPIAMAFMSYQAQALEKLIREIHGALGKGPDAKASQKFLAAHMAAVGMLAGTLGLPFVTLIASVIDRLADLFGDEKDKPFDVQAGWRNFLTDMLGKDVGEVLARGLPRALNIDVSQRIGEQSIIPFSKFIADKRKWEDSLKDLAVGTLGSPVSMMSNIAQGMNQIANGNVMDGMVKGLPTAFRNLAQGYKLADQGYTDTKGAPMPMTAGASDIVAQITGFSPARKAEYQEARMNDLARKGVLSRDAQNLRNAIAKAIEQGDRETAREKLREAQAWDKAHPEMAVLPRMASVLMQRQRALAMAEAMGTPLGVNRNDTGAGNRARFANY